MIPIEKRKPHIRSNYILYKKCTGYRDMKKEYNKLILSPVRIFIHKIGGLGEKYPYEIWIIKKGEK